MRTFLDANVLFSASNASRPIGQLVERLLAVSEVVTSDYAADEARRNLAAKWPKHLAGLDPLVARIEVVRSVLFPLPIELAEKDRPLLCTAIRAGCDMLATGDLKDFGHLLDHTVEGTTIINLTRLAERTVEAERAR